MILLSIDPNVKRMALVEWHDGKLVKTYYLRSDLKGALSTFEQLCRLDVEPDVIAVEVPEIYARAVFKKKGLMKLGFYAGFACGALYCPDHTEVVEYLPKEWKGQVSKEVMAPRIMGKLSEKEIKNIDFPGFKTMDHDIVDAIGIGLKYLGRL